MCISAAVSSIDRYASIGGLSNQSGSMATQVDSMATQVGSAVDEQRLTSVEHDVPATKLSNSISSGE